MMGEGGILNNQGSMVFSLIPVTPGSLAWAGPNALPFPHHSSSSFGFYRETINFGLFVRNSCPRLVPLAMGTPMNRSQDSCF